MQAEKNSVASAKAGMEKTQAILDGKMENMEAHDTAQTEKATRKKDERITQIELEEKQARACNAATKETGKAGTGHLTGNHPISALPGHGGDQPVVGSHPVETDTGTGTCQSTGDHLISDKPGKPVMGSDPFGNGTDTGTATGHPTGNYPISALPGHGSGHHVVGSQPVGTDTGTGIGQPTGTHPISASPGHGGGQPVVGSNPVGTDTGTGTCQYIGDYPISALPEHGSGQHVVGSKPVGTDTSHPISALPGHMENMRAHDTAQKEMATRKKDERITQIEPEEKQARAFNAATKETGKSGKGHPTGNHPISALPGHMENMKAHDTPQKEMTTRKKDERITQTKLEEKQARDCNAATKETGKAGTGHPTGNHPISALPGHDTGTGTGTNGTYSTTGDTGHPTGTHPTSALPGHGTGQPAVQVIEVVVGSQPIATYTAAVGRTAAQPAHHDPHVEGNAPGYGTGEPL